MTINIRNCIFGFKCTKKWEDLNYTSNKGVKFCDDCQREVHFIDDVLSLEQAIILNRCVAVSTPSEKNEIVTEVTVGMVLPINYDEAAFKRKAND